MMNVLVYFGFSNPGPWNDNLLCLYFLRLSPLKEYVLFGLGFLYFPQPYLRLSIVALNLVIGRGPMLTDPGAISFHAIGLNCAKKTFWSPSAFSGDVSGDTFWLDISDLEPTDKLETGLLSVDGCVWRNCSWDVYPSLSGGFLFLVGYLCSCCAL